VDILYVLGELPDAVAFVVSKIPLSCLCNQSPALRIVEHGFRHLNSSSTPMSASEPSTGKIVLQAAEASLSNEPELPEFFWMSVQKYCGYLRCTYKREAGGVTPSAVILNDAYASLMGMENSELTAR
jgi:hypothetical protein